MPSWAFSGRDGHPPRPPRPPQHRGALGLGSLWAARGKAAKHRQKGGLGPWGLGTTSMDQSVGWMIFHDFPIETAKNRHFSRKNPIFLRLFCWGFSSPNEHVRQALISGTGEALGDSHILVTYIPICIYIYVIWLNYMGYLIYIYI